MARYVDILENGFQTCLDNGVADGSLRGDVDTAEEARRLVPWDNPIEEFHDLELLD